MDGSVRDSRGKQNRGIPAGTGDMGLTKVLGSQTCWFLFCFQLPRIPDLTLASGSAGEQSCLQLGHNSSGGSGPALPFPHFFLASSSTKRAGKTCKADLCFWNCWKEPSKVAFRPHFHWLGINFHPLGAIKALYSITQEKDPLKEPIKLKPLHSPNCHWSQGTTRSTSEQIPLHTEDIFIKNINYYMVKNRCLMKTRKILTLTGARHWRAMGYLNPVHPKSGVAHSPDRFWH